jgi:hypothetical protein
MADESYCKKNMQGLIQSGKDATYNFRQEFSGYLTRKVDRLIFVPQVCYVKQ